MSGSGVSSSSRSAASPQTWRSSRRGAPSRRAVRSGGRSAGEKIRPRAPPPKAPSRDAGGLPQGRGAGAPKRRPEEELSPVQRRRGMSRAEKTDRVREVLQLVGLRRDSGALYPHEFSGGQRQRIAIARALVTYPKFVILDEPVSALDVSIRAQILNLLKGLQERLGLAYVMISHDLAAARYLSKRLAVMDAGQLVGMGESDAVYATPRHSYMQALLAATLPLHL